MMSTAQMVILGAFCLVPAGGTLRTWVNNLERKPLDVPKILLVLKDLASGLATMHPDFGEL